MGKEIAAWPKFFCWTDEVALLDSQELRKVYGSGHQTQLASKFVLYAINQALQFLQTNYNGKIFAVIDHAEKPPDFGFGCVCLQESGLGGDHLS